MGPARESLSGGLMSASTGCGHNAPWFTLCVDIVAKVPDRWELTFLLLKNSTDDR